MKTISLNVAISAIMLTSSLTLCAQTVVNPTGGTLGGAWGGWSIDGEFAGYGPGVNENYDRLIDVGVVKTSTGTFHTTSGYTVNPDWSGSFGISSVKTGGTDGTITADLNFVPSTAFQPSAGSIIDTLTSYSYIQFNTSSTGADYTFDFSTLDIGYLPAGTLIATSGRYNLGNAFTMSSNLGTPFLTYLAAEPLYDSASTPGAVAELTFNSGIYNFEIVSQFGSSETNGAQASFQTSENITSLTVSSLGFSDAYTVWLLAPVTPVPEPSGAVLVCLASAMVLFRRKR